MGLAWYVKAQIVNACPKGTLLYCRVQCPSGAQLVNYPDKLMSVYAIHPGEEKIEPGLGEEAEAAAAQLARSATQLQILCMKHIKCCKRVTSVKHAYTS